MRAPSYDHCVIAPSLAENARDSANRRRSEPSSSITQTAATSPCFEMRLKAICPVVGDHGGIS